MARRRKKVKRNVYGVDVSRYSVYPQVRVSREDQKPGILPPKPGSVIHVRVSSVDEDGTAVGVYKGFTVRVRGAEPGDSVKVVVERIAGKTIYARRAE